MLRRNRTDSPVGQKTMSSRFRLSYIALSSLLTLQTLACVDPKKTFGEFEDRVVDAAPIPDAGGGGGIFDINGPFLLSMATREPAPVSPIRFLAEVSFTETEDGGTADINVQPLADERCAEGMGGQPVGKALVLEGVPIGADGSFNVNAKGTTVGEDANPLCAVIEADIELTGAMQSADVFCGTIGGRVNAPLPGDLAGTFAAIRLDEPVMTGDANLPPPVTACPTAEGSDAAP
jgi:hypothetical protein